MIKFFRKIRQNLLMENKTGKYFKYAIGEIVLVVIGILIALQINNWNENRVAQARIEIRLTNMIQDLEDDIDENNEILNKAKNRIILKRAILKRSDILGSFRDTDTIYLGEISDSFKNPNTIITQMATFDGNMSTYKSFINSGESYLIKNQLLAENIQEYYESIVKLKERGDVMLSSWELISNSRHRLGIGSFTSIGIEKLIDLAKTDKQFGAELETTYRLDLWQYNFISEHQKGAKKLKQIIEQRNK